MTEQNSEFTPGYFVRGSIWTWWQLGQFRGAPTVRYCTQDPKEDWVRVRVTLASDEEKEVKEDGAADVSRAGAGGAG